MLKTDLGSVYNQGLSGVLECHLDALSYRSLYDQETISDMKRVVCLVNMAHR